MAIRKRAVFLGAVAAVSLVWLDLSAQAQAPDPAAANKAVAMRVFDEIFNQKRLSAAAEIYAPDFVNHGLHRDFSLAEDQAAVRSEVTAFPDLRMSVDRIIGDGDFVTVVWIFRGTHTAFGYGLPPTGAKVEMRGITVWRIVDGRIREEWTSFDSSSAYLQAARHLKWFFLAVVAILCAILWLLLRVLCRRWSRIPASAAQARG